ncbi:TBC domain-containing protein kinase-like protein [Plutella xylostella]|uniref:TBC domain-containing protein kinase-like protein n=1 Tax=Plutella xylostella TaxID=51655 RepID=UPI00203269AA|nr:TBC domain-containing protein kinase-like protein [Plutella xylostella]
MSEDHCRFAATTYFAKNHPGETCGSNGLPLTPSSITILGRAQKLLTINHTNLCTYLDVIREKHERIIVVSEVGGKPLKDLNYKLSYENISNVGRQVSSALEYLHEMQFTHRTLAPDNILLDEQNRVKLFNYGMFYMTGGGSDVSFPLGLPKYLSPETILNGGGPSSDVWSLGIILLELCLGPLWTNLKPGPVLRRILTLVHSNNAPERIAREHDCYDKYMKIPENLRNIIEKCLKMMPSERATPSELVEEFSQVPCTEVLEAPPPRGLAGCRLQFVYHWWQLAGGDVLAELKTQGLVKNSPPILSMPVAVLLDGCTLGGKTPALFDRRVAHYTLDRLRARLAHVPPAHFHPLMHEPRHTGDAVSLPRIIRERDTEYQFYRILWFQRLLDGYPHTADLIKQEAATDIPPLLRAAVWAALLGVRGDVKDQYERVDKETPTPTDRQIDVDIPRCHQYSWRLAGGGAHAALRRLLKAWLATHPPAVYWQGLDSLTAPFLYLNFCDEARAFACLSAFIPAYLHQFFLKDNSQVIREYLAKFRQTAAYHEPALAAHLADIGFVPELFAIPWFLTMFSHVFPLHKIFLIWDALTAGGARLPLALGAALLRRLRGLLLGAGFNECILLFSDLPEVDIPGSVEDALEMSRKTPPSISYRRFANQPPVTDPLDMVEIPLDALLTETSPRISIRDVVTLVQEDRCTVVDIRSNLLFEKQCVRGSINMPYSGVQLGTRELRGPGGEALRRAGARGTTLVVAGDEDAAAVLFSDYLVKCGVARVCVLHGGLGALHTHAPGLFTQRVA